IELLDKMLKDALSVDEDYTMKLYKNDYTPIGSSTAVDFTEADFTNYTAATLTRANWGAVTTVNNKAQSTYSAQQSWTCGTGGIMVYCYYIVGATSVLLLWGERFSAARILSDGNILKLAPIISRARE